MKERFNYDMYNNIKLLTDAEEAKEQKVRKFQKPKTNALRGRLTYIFLGNLI
jgi:hypothetical protein